MPLPKQQQQMSLKTKLLKLLLYLSVCWGMFGTVSAQKKSVSQLERYLKEAQQAEQQTDAPKACAAYKKAINICRTLPQEKEKLPTLLFQYGSVLSYAGEYNKATATLKEALSINEKNTPTDSLLSARIYMQFGVLHFFQEHWDEALYFYKKAEASALSLGNQQGVSIAANNIANIYQKKKAYKNAIISYEKCLKIQEQLKDTATICNTLFNIGTCYEELGQTKKALSYFTDSYTFASAINDAEIIPLSLIHQASILQKNKEYKKAKKLLNDAEAKAKNVGYKQVLAEIYKAQTTFYEQENDYKNALKAYKNYQALEKTILNEKLEVETKALEMQLKTKDKEQEIIRQKDKIANQKLLLWMLGIFSAIGLVFTIAIYWLWRIRQKQNRELTQLNKTKTKLFHIISHDLMTPAVAQKEAIGLLKKQVETSNDETVKTYCAILHENTENQFQIIESLINWAKVQTKTIKSNPYTIDIIPILQKEIKLYEISAQQKSINLSASLVDSCFVFIDKDMLSIVVRNLINNAVKFTKTNGSVHISCQTTDDKVTISVEDDGVGMSEKQIQSFYDTSKQMDVKFGTKGEKGTGLGLVLCYELLTYNNSELLIESKKNRGTRIKFSLKKENNND